MASPLESVFDCVLMLTWSNWKTEPRSNRYHYASRFSRHLPVYFVQPDLTQPSDDVVVEPTELPNVHIWHVDATLSAKSGLEQKRVLETALARHGARKPLVWVYNVRFEPVLGHLDGAYRVYHATEDYFSVDQFRQPESFRRQLRRLLQKIDLLVSVSTGVEESYQRRGKYAGSALTLPNGCDFGFFAAGPDSVKTTGKAALFQGGINDRLDFALLTALADRMPDWEFRFCGMADESLQAWQALKSRSNVNYLGYLEPEGIRAACYQADVGLIPYRQTPMIVERSLPIKAFEYVACGLPVVSVPIQALEPFDVFAFAKAPAAFEKLMRELAASRHDAATIEHRRRVAATMDYDKRFDVLTQYLIQHAPGRIASRPPAPPEETPGRLKTLLYKLQDRLLG